MTALVPLLSLALADPGLRLSVDRAYLPSGSGDATPTLHLAARELPEVEVTLYQVADPRSALLDDPEPGEAPPAASAHPPRLETALASLVRGLRQSYRALWSALNPAAQGLARTLFHLKEPFGSSLSRWEILEPGRVRTGEPPLRSWRLDTLDPGWNYADLELGQLSAGTYRVEAQAKGRRAEVLLLVSRLSLMAQRSAGGTTVLALDASDGHILPGVEILGRRGSRSPEPLGRTDASGLLVLRGNVSQSILAGFVGPMAARVQLPAFPESLGRDPGAGAVLFDRDRYRPGDMVRVWALLRSAVASKLPGSTDRRWAVPEEPTARMTLLNRQGAALVTQFVTISALGVAAADLLLPEGISPGEYTVAVTWGEARAGGDITVIEDSTPDLNAVWQLLEFVPLHQPFSASLRVTDRRGDPVPGLAIHWRLERRRDLGGAADESDGRVRADGPSVLIADGSTITDSSRRVVIPIGPQQLPGRLIFHAEAVDAAGRSTTAESSLPVRQVPVWLKLSTDRRVLRTGRPASVLLEATGLGMSPYRGRVFLHAMAVHTAPGGEEVRSELQQRWVETDAHGRATLNLTPNGPGYVEVDANLDAGERPLAQLSLFVTDQGGDIPTTPDRLTLVPDRSEYLRGEEARVLILTPFESGTVLLGIDPTSGPAEVVVPIHGYSGIAHVRIPSSGNCWLDAGALVGGIFYRERKLVLASEKGGPTIRITAERLAHAGQHLTVVFSATNAEGRPMPAMVSAVVSRHPLRDPRLRELLPMTRALPRLWVASSGSFDSIRSHPEASSAARPLRPYGPGQLDESSETGAGRDEGATSAQLLLDDRGRGTWGLRVPQGVDHIYITARVVAGTDEFASKSVRLPVTREPWLELHAPRWSRGGDLIGIDAWPEGLAAGVEAPVELTSGGGGSALAHRTVDAAGRTHALVRSRARPPILEVAATVTSQKLGARRAVALLPSEKAEPATNTRELAQRLTEGLLLIPEGEGRAELACAAVLALGGLSLHPLPRERSWLVRASTAAVARLAQEEEIEGGFAGGKEELPRDRAALEGLLALASLPVAIDAQLIVRTRERVEHLAPATPAPARSGPPARTLTLAEVAEASAGKLLVMSRAPRLTVALRAALLKQALSLLPTAAPLDAAALAATLAAMPETPLGAWRPAAERLSVRRRYEVVERSPWTETLLAEDEEPPDPVFRPVASPLQRGAEVRVSLEAGVPQRPGLQCLTDFPAAGLLPLGRSPDPGGSQELLLCAAPIGGRLAVSYLARAAHAGRFQVPQPALGFANLVGRSGASPWLEILR